MVLPPSEIPNRDVRIPDEFVRDHEPLISWLAAALARVLDKERAVDFDAREGIEALIKTYRTLESGLIYETKPTNPYAASIQEALQQAIAEFRTEITKETGMQTVRDAEITGALVFLQRLELQNNNGRKRGRAFCDFLRGFFPAEQTAAASTLIAP